MIYRDFLKDLEGQKLYYATTPGIHILKREKYGAYTECTLLRVEDDFIVLGFEKNGIFTKALTLYAPITSVHCEFPEEKK
jgi:hypothetical protein